MPIPAHPPAPADPDHGPAPVPPRLNPLRPVVTVWRDGRLLGIVTPKVVREQLKSLVAAPR